MCPEAESASESEYTRVNKNQSA